MEVKIAIDSKYSTTKDFNYGIYGAVLECKKRRVELKGWYSNITKERADLISLFVSLKKIKRPCDLTVYTNSKYIKSLLKDINIFRLEQMNCSIPGIKLSKDCVSLLKEIIPLLRKHNVRIEGINESLDLDINIRIEELINETYDEFKCKYRIGGKHQLSPPVFDTFDFLENMKR